MKISKEPYHIPVLLEESLEGLSIQPSGIYLDLTYGGGGHTKGLLSRLGKGGRVYGFDQDSDAMLNLPDDDRFTFVLSNFRFVQNFMDYHKAPQVDGILADLGVSWHHFDDADRGFSFRFDAPLDMRMNNRSSMTAAKLLNTYTEAALAEIFRKYGEISNARRLACAVVRHRFKAPFQTTADLLACAQAVGIKHDNKKYLAQVFQAIRIEVNDELQALCEMLVQAPKLLKPGGRIAVITYHSLEDRMVKNYFKTGNIDGESHPDMYGKVNLPMRPVNHKVIKPSVDEVTRNPRSRSAKLRIAEKLSL
jgi:16S rRNA (cytosine1402-N4)-methyltransferase